MGEDREGHPVWYDNFKYDFRGSFIPYIYRHIHILHLVNLHLQQKILLMYYIGLYYSVSLDDIITHFMYQAELCLQHCAKATIQVL